MSQKLTMEQFLKLLPQSLLGQFTALGLKVADFYRINKQGEKYWWKIFLIKDYSFELFYHLGKDYSGWVIREIKANEPTPIWEQLDTKTAFHKWRTAIKNSSPVHITCPRCLGMKTIPRFAHIEEGLCFQCKGEGTLLR